MPLTAGGGVTRFIPVCTGNTSGGLSTKGGWAVYPCVYREHFVLVITPALLFGLSLCVQGTHRRLPQILPTERFIPVCTGNAYNLRVEQYCPPVYPCVYRERGIPLIIFWIESGLSLCVQGTQ